MIDFWPHKIDANILYQPHLLHLNFESHKDWVDICSFIRKIWNRSIDPWSRSIDFSSTDEFRSIDYKVDRSICLGQFSNWQEQTWTLEMIEIILDVFSGLSRMFWISFQLRLENKIKHKSTTKHYIYNTNLV